jgi:hypothetical protein
MDSVTLISQFLFKQFIEEPDDLNKLILFCMQPHLILGLISQIIKVSIELSLYSGVVQLLDYCFIG